MPKQNIVEATTVSQENSKSAKAASVKAKAAGKSTKQEFTPVNMGEGFPDKRVDAVTKEKILAKLEATYAGTETALNYNSPFELLVAVVLSAQCTDDRVNVITSRIFPRLNTPEKMGALSLQELEEEIRDCGLYHAKAKNLLGACQMLIERFDSKVPDTIEALMELPGVGKKTANVVASVVYKVPAIAVDTHVFRVSHRLGLAQGKDPLETEAELQWAIPMEKWSEAHHWFIWHGRRVCKARKPLCQECVLCQECPFKEKNL